MADLTAEGRRKAADDGAARADGSYPIRTKRDLAKAIMAFGRSNPSDRAAVRRHIIKRARALGAVSMLPDAWHVNE